MRIVLLTGNQLRHRFAAASLASSCTLAGVVFEAKAAIVGTPKSLNDEDRLTIEQHFAERDQVEANLLGHSSSSLIDIQSKEVPHGFVNTPEVLDWIRRCEADLIVLYGTSIIKAPMLDAFPDRIINIHLGLSPYYRGSATNFWPLVYGEPECVGATIHLAVAKVDAGAILTQVRPEVGTRDRAHELGTKTLIAALEALPPVMSSYLLSETKPQSQDLSQGRVFKNKDFNAASVRTMWRNFESGMINEYLLYSRNRLEKYPIIEASVASLANSN